MRGLIQIGIWLACCVPCAAMSSFRADDTSLANVMQGLAIRTSNFENLAFRITTHEQIRQEQDGPLIQRDQIADATISSDGRFRALVVEKLPANGVFGEMETLKHEVASDGKQTRQISESLSMGAGGISREGTIKAARGYDVGFSPLQIVSLGRWSIPDYLRKAQARLDGEETIAGVRTVRLRWESTRPNRTEASDRGTFWIAPSLGYAPVMVERSWRPTSNHQWRTIYSAVCKDFQLVGELWLPRYAKVEEHLYSPDSYETRRKLDVQFEAWKENQQLPPATFDLVFPKGTRVSDLIRDTGYVVGEIDDAKLDRQVSGVRQVESSTEVDLLRKLELSSTDRRNPMVPIVLAGLLVVLASLGSLVLWTRRRRGKDQ